MRKDLAMAPRFRPWLFAPLLALACTEPAAAPAGLAGETVVPAAVPAAVAVAAADAESAKALYAQRCTMCHGVQGQGDGPAAANLNPKPRNYTDPVWQSKTSDAHIAQIIIGGGPSVGMSAMMPGNPDLKDKPQVVAELVKIVRGFKK